MGIKLGNLDISSFKVGSADCAIYLGDVKLYPTGSTPTLQWVTFSGGDDISGLDVYGIKGVAGQMMNTFNIADGISITPSRRNAEINISDGLGSFCYGDAVPQTDNIELIFSNIGCNDYYTLSSTIVGTDDTFQLLIYA